MKLQSQGIAGVLVGAVIAIGAVILFMPVKQDPFYAAAKVDGNLLKTMYNSDFSKLVLNFKYNASSMRFELSAAAINPSGGPVAIKKRRCPGDSKIHLCRLREWLLF